MTEKAVTLKAEALPDLDDLLQCPVCYEIPTGQIFQCNEGHHVCGRCKLRLDVCPVCRAFFFGTRNYAMEELIASIRNVRAFKLGGKVTTGINLSPEQQSEAKESTSEENDSNNEDDEASRESVNQALAEPPKQCSGLFRCLCCKTNPERLPCGRLINHLRYYHSSDLIEGRAEENGEYLQAWEFATDVGRIVTAVRVGTLGLFFLVIEITDNSICTWLVMAASPRVAQEFCYTYTLSGNDREAIFSDCVWSVRTCEGFLKKRERCLLVRGGDAEALLTPATISAKLRIRRMLHEAGSQQVQPRAVLRIANRSEPARSDSVSQELEPFLQDLQNDVARLSRAFATLGSGASALVEAEMRSRFNVADNEILAPAAEVDPAPNDRPPRMSRNARRRMRQRLLHALEANIAADDHPLFPMIPEPIPETDAIPTTGRNRNSRRSRIADISTLGPDNEAGQNDSGAANSDLNMANNPRTNNHADNDNNNQHRENTAQRNMRAHSPVQDLAAPVDPAPPVAPPPVPPPSNVASAGGPAANGNGGRNKKKRRQRR